jgi:3-oxoacyl-[acyl-carrier protein] reductase
LQTGSLNIVVNNAGLAIRKLFKETTPEDWRRQIDVNLLGAIHLCHEASPYLEKGGHGRIIAIVGDSSRVGESGLSIVGAARWCHRVDEITCTGNGARRRYREHGLARSCRDRARSSVAERQSQQTRQVLSGAATWPAEDIAPTVALLASPRSGWITGQVISISGGYCMV